MSAGSGINCQKSSLVTNIATYFDSSKFSDMTIKCNGRVFNCHRIVVCSQCMAPFVFLRIFAK